MLGPVTARQAMPGKKVEILNLKMIDYRQFNSSQFLNPYLNIFMLLFNIAIIVSSVYLDPPSQLFKIIFFHPLKIYPLFYNYGEKSTFSKGRTFETV